MFSYKDNTLKIQKVDVQPLGINIMDDLQQSYRTYLENAGAIFRDYNVLGWYSWGDRDTVEGLKTYIERRLEVIDERYK